MTWGVYLGPAALSQDGEHQGRSRLGRNEMGCDVLMLRCFWDG